MELIPILKMYSFKNYYNGSHLEKYYIQGKGWTGLILASRNGRLFIVRKLLDKGAGVNMSTTVRPCIDV